MQVRTQRCHISTKLLPTLQLWFQLFLFFWSFIIILMANQVKKNVWSDKNRSHGAHSEYLRINELARTVGMINSTFIKQFNNWVTSDYMTTNLPSLRCTFQSHQFDKKRNTDRSRPHWGNSYRPLLLSSALLAGGGRVSATLTRSLGEMNVTPQFQRKAEIHRDFTLKLKWTNGWLRCRVHSLFSSSFSTAVIHDAAPPQVRRG